MTTTTPSPATPAELATRPVRVALIGSGGMGAVHATSLHKNPDADLRWVVDLDLTRAQDVAARTGSRATASMDEALADPEVDAVVIALPTSVHRPATEAAAKAGKHVFCEKPIARTAEDGRAMVAACEAAGVTLMIGHVVRFYPEYQRIKELVDNGDLGTIGMVRASRLNSPVHERSPWFADVEKNGGVVLDLMVHELDTLCWMFGDVERVYAHGLTYTPVQPTRDYAAASIRFRAGMLAHVDCSFAHSNFRTSIEVSGSNGMVVFDSEHASTLTWEPTTPVRPGTNSLERPARVLSRPSVSSPHESELRHYIACLRSGDPVMVTGDDGVRAITLANSVLDSMRTGKPVSFNLDGTVAA